MLERNNCIHRPWIYLSKLGRLPLTTEVALQFIYSDGLIALEKNDLKKLKTVHEDYKRIMPTLTVNETSKAQLNEELQERIALRLFNHQKIQREGRW